ncbi:four helix bundle protein [Candidatus Nomurabacteria bacterium]|nr:four helix bundle protein [Candidatus Nomurabacteria bacterium]
MEETINNFTKLIGWQKCHRVVLEIYKITKKFPQDEKFGLTDQIRRASVSITSNIAEGFGRKSAKDKSHFYSMAKGSLFETQNQLIIAKDLNYIEEKEYNIINEMIIESLKIVSGLIKSAMDY